LSLNSKKAISKLKSIDVFTTIMENAKPINQPGAGNVFNELVKNIAYQQISYKAAETVYKNFVGIIGREDYSPKQILLKDYELIKSAGFSYRKTDYIVNIANFFEEKKLYKFDWTKLEDHEIIDLLSQIKGVGIWTVQMILIFELNRPDVFPSLDLAIQYVIKDLYKLQTEKKALIKEIEKISEDWAPYRTLASLYLWGFRRWQLEQNKSK
jgi:DNA-3-methyladenine glycosylase II